MKWVKIKQIALNIDGKSKQRCQRSKMTVISWGNKQVFKEHFGIKKGI